MSTTAPTSTPYGFRITGPCTGARKLIDHARAFAAYCAAEVPGGIESEAYLSAFTFGDPFRDHLHSTGSTKGYDGPCGASWLWWDIDRPDTCGGLDAATRDARALCGHLGHAFAVSDDALLVFYSGSKGYHVALPLHPGSGGFAPPPGPMFHRIARRFAEGAAADAAVSIDTGIYDRVRALRAPNSKHPKTGRFKRRLSVEELLHLDTSRIVQLARKPEPFDLPDPDTCPCGFELPAAWNAAADKVEAQAQADAQRRHAIAGGDTQATINRATFDFIREGASTGDRHRLLFSAAANLAQCGASLHLAGQLLNEAALDAGLSPSEVSRQVRCGFDHATGQATAPRKAGAA